MIEILVVEDNKRLQPALVEGLEATGEVIVTGACETGESALESCFMQPPDAIIMDVQLAGSMHGIDTAVAIRREFPRMPVIFYSIQDDDAYYRAFRQAGILSHYAYVRKSNFLLPPMLIPLLRDAISGRGFIDPDIEARVQEVRERDEQNPMALLEPNEQVVMRMLAQGMSNEQIAARLGFRDKRTVSRTNGQIYTAWGLNASTTDEKLARSRAILIFHEGRLLTWDDDGSPLMQDTRGEWVPYTVRTVN
jgi:DNA-binding NarL/FixJ family response regulator